MAETITTSVIGVPGGMTLADILVPAGLADNGGPTQTIALALVAGNPAIDTGTSSVCAGAPVNALDQRGMPRPAACDIGAYEAQPPTLPFIGSIALVTTSPTGVVLTYSLPEGTDEQGGATSVACVPPSGSTFPIGVTTVTCTATDAVGHTGTQISQVNVQLQASSASPAPTGTPTATPKPLPNAAMPSRGTDGSPALLWICGVLAVGLITLGLTYRRDRRPRR